MGLFDRAMDGGAKAQARFFAAAVARWSFAQAPPTGWREVLEQVPWDLLAMLGSAYLVAFKLSDAEEADIMCRASTGNSNLRIPELSKLAICERLKVPYGKSYSNLPAGEVLRLTQALNIEAELKNQFSGG